MERNQLWYFLLFLLDILIILSMVVTSVISSLMVMKYIKDIFTLTYISNIDLIQLMIKTLGFTIVSIVSLMNENYWSKNMLSDKIDTKLNTKLGITVMVIVFIILLFVGWNFYLFMEWVV